MPATGRIVLFFGFLRRYKGVEDLLQAWSDNESEDRLVVLGACDDPELRADLEKYALPSVVLRLSYASDEELGGYLQAADFACFPFRQVTTSSSINLALEARVPVIIPDLEALSGVADGCSLVFKSNSVVSLAEVLLKARTASNDDLRRMITLTTKRRKSSWADAAEQAIQLFEEVL